MQTATDSLIVHAAVLGTIAFKAGKKCVPCHDGELMRLVSEVGGPVGSSLPLFKAWTKAWHDANLCK